MMNIKAKNPNQGLRDWSVAFQNIRTMPHNTLYNLQGYISARTELYEKACFGVVMFVLSSPAWFIVAVVMGLSGATKLATLFMWFVPFSLLLALAAWLCLYFVVFSDLPTEKEQLERIQIELRRRGRGQFSFASDN